MEFIANVRPSGTVTARLSAPSPLLALMMLPLAAIGTGMAVNSARMLFNLMLMQGWTIVPATIQKAELSEDGKTKTVDASYSYIVNGRTYRSTRFSIYGADNLGSFADDAVQELQGYRNRNEPYPLHVNPKDPSQAILKPVFRLGAVFFSLLFIMLFGALGGGTIFSFCRGWVQSRKEAKLVKQYPNEPWKQRLDWLANRIKNTQTSDPSRAVASAIFWNVSTFPVWMIIPSELGRRHYDAFTFLIVPLIGAGLVCWVVMALARSQAVRGTYVQLHTMPGWLGERLRGRIYARTLESAAFANLSLRCEVYDGNPPTRANRAAGFSLNADGSRDIWRAGSTAQVARDQLGPGDAMLDVTFDIPAGLPSSQRGPSLRCRWLLAATARVKGRDSTVEMEVPVFAR